MLVYSYARCNTQAEGLSWADSVLTSSLLVLAPWRRYLLLTCASRRGKRARIILLTTTPPSVVIQSHPPLFHCSVKQILLPITAPYNSVGTVLGKNTLEREEIRELGLNKSLQLIQVSLKKNLISYIFLLKM